jgi:hypothetical protein
MLIFAGLISVANIIHHFTVSDALIKNGAGFETGFFSHRHYSELKEYKKLCLEKSESLIWWEILIILHIIIGLMGIGMVLFYFL